MDEKYDILKHPNVALTTDGKGKPYIHGNDEISWAALTLNTKQVDDANAEITVEDDEYLFFSDDEIEELIVKRISEIKNKNETFPK